MGVAKTKTLISFTVTVKLICIFVFAYAKCSFSHDAAHMYIDPLGSKFHIKLGCTGVYIIFPFSSLKH